ncbi:hypothetical protein C0Q70_09305 [Pomacea canaliculata]|uniref:Notch ligand N-terminal domain-containing protein n=1 Tax=Pomacea canaliculata TaxID=400727 RepID=A0A2T7P9F2_POMCA|nr:hypothetical protein C0Q70_09305 [Pomacea canaliculata]
MPCSATMARKAAVILTFLLLVALAAAQGSDDACNRIGGTCQYDSFIVVGPTERFVFWVSIQTLLRSSRGGVCQEDTSFCWGGRYQATMAMKAVIFTFLLQAALSAAHGRVSAPHGRVSAPHGKYQTVLAMRLEAFARMTTTTVGGPMRTVCVLGQQTDVAVFQDRIVLALRLEAFASMTTSTVGGPTRTVCVLG